jgi:membrane protein
VRLGAKPDGASLQKLREAFRAIPRTVDRFLDHRLVDWGAALTFYASISLIPALVIIIGLLGVIGDSATDQLVDNLQQRDAGPGRSIALDAVEQVRTNRGTAAIALVVGLLGALWSASGYVGCFLRAQGVIYESTRRYPFWKLRPLQIAVTGGVIVAIACIALAVVITGPLAEQLAQLVGLEDVVATVWDLAKWPAIVLLVVSIFAVLSWASPEGRERGFRWLTPGGVIATTAWVAGSAGYAVYIDQFANYNAVYGGLGAVIGFLAWLWLSNMAMLFGAELNAELERGPGAAQGAGPGVGEPVDGSVSESAEGPPSSVSRR